MTAAIRADSTVTARNAKNDVISGDPFLTSRGHRGVSLRGGLHVSALSSEAERVRQAPGRERCTPPGLLVAGRYQ
jgi:hypothetical protein